MSTTNTETNPIATWEKFHHASANLTGDSRVIMNAVLAGELIAAAYAEPYDLRTPNQILQRAIATLTTTTIREIYPEIAEALKA